MTAVAAIVVAAGCLYLLTAAWAVRRFAAERPMPPTDPVPVTILKPLCGAEPDLHDLLHSFCRQDYPRLQVVFGVQGEDDPAIAVVRRLIADLPGADLALVVDGRRHGGNLKVGNLINMMAAARHDLLVIADSDMKVTPAYLGAVTAPLADPAVGAVTCLYAGRCRGGRWSRLAAMAINYGFLPSVLVGRLGGRLQGCFGATIALKRATLERVGGFAALRDHLADDHALGEAVRAQGLRVVLSPYVVEDRVAEADFAALVRHELRWARTIRAVAPWSFAASAITHPGAWALLAIPLAGWAAAPLVLGAFAALLALMRTVERALALPPAPAWLALPRDLLSLAVLVMAFCGNTVIWRGRRFAVGPDGRLVMKEDPRS